MSSESLFEMKACLVASLPTTEISLVWLEGMCKCLCVCICVHVCLILYVTILTIVFPDVCV